MTPELDKAICMAIAQALSEQNPMQVSLIFALHEILPLSLQAQKEAILALTAVYDKHSPIPRPYK